MPRKPFIEGQVQKEKPVSKYARKKKRVERDPASSDSSDLDYPDHRKRVQMKKYEARVKLGLKKPNGEDQRRRKRIRGRRRIRSPRDTKYRKTDVYGEIKEEPISEGGIIPGEEKEIHYTEYISMQNDLDHWIEVVKKEEEDKKNSKVHKKYRTYKRITEAVKKAKEQEEKDKKNKEDLDKRSFERERFEKTGAIPEIVHLLKFVLHAHNKHFVFFNDPVPSKERDEIIKAISMGKAKTIDTFLIRYMKNGDIIKKKDEIDKLIEYAKRRLEESYVQDMKYFPPRKPVYDDGTEHSVRIGMDIQRFTMSRQGFARMDPIKDEYSRHVISPETTSKERAKRLAEGLADAVDRDLQDMPKIRKIQNIHEKAMKSLKEAIRGYVEGPILPEKVLQRNDIREKIDPLLQVLHNNQHPGLIRERDFFEEALQEIHKEDCEKQISDNIAQFSLSYRKKSKSTLKSKDFDKTNSGFLVRDGPEDLDTEELSSQIIEIMKKVPIRYTHPDTNTTIVVGERLTKPKEGEEPDYDPSGNPLAPVPIKQFPFTLRGDSQDQNKLYRALKKMQDESNFSADEYKSLFYQSVAPKEPHIEALYGASIAPRESNSVPTNRMGQKIRQTGYGKVDRRKGTSITLAQKKMKFNEKESSETKKGPTELSLQIKEAIDKQEKERLEDQEIICPRLTDYREDTVEDEEPSKSKSSIFSRKSCITYLIEEDIRRQNELEWSTAAYAKHSGSLEDVVKNPSLYDGAGGEGIAGLGEPCSKEYIAEFLREPVGSERLCVNGDRCLGTMIPLFNHWPDTADISSSERGPILREFFRPEQLKGVKEKCVYPNQVNPCVLCIDYLTTQTCYSFMSSDTAPSNIIQYYRVTLDQENGYSKKVCLKFYSSKNRTPTGIILPCKMFRAQDYHLSKTKVAVGDKQVEVRCYKERIYTEDSSGSGGIMNTLDGEPIVLEDFWGASVVSPSRS